MRKQRLKRRLLFLISLALIFWALVFSFDYFGLSKNKNPIDFTVSEGESLSSVADRLKEEKIINYKNVFKIKSRLKKGFVLQKGTHKLDKNFSYSTILHVLGTSVDTSIAVTIPEGYELSQIAALLHENGITDEKAFLNECKYGEFSYWFLNDVPARENRLEGYLFPDTYKFEKGTAPRVVIEAMLTRFKEVIPENYGELCKKHGLTFDETIILASVVEREAVDLEDKKKVASVFLNRLKSDKYPYLQSCATVQYILGERKKVLSVADTNIKSAYNTYVVKGLPIGPISMPGLDSVNAVIFAPETDYYFFVVGKDGKHVFSKTFAEHNAVQGAN